MSLKTSTYVIALLSVFLIAPESRPQTKKGLLLKQSNELEVVLEGGRYLTYIIGNVVFETETGKIYCDSAVWDKGKSIRLKGNVNLEDRDFRISADSVYYDLKNRNTTAYGERVELWSYEDSLYAVGVHAFYDRENEFMYMEQRPLLYLKYPDSTNMIEILADRIEYDAEGKTSLATGNVRISSKDLSASSGRAVYYIEEDSLVLTEGPIADRRNSRVSGNLIAVNFKNKSINSIDVIDSARGEFNEPVGDDTTQIDRSIISGKEIHFNFTESELTSIVCFDQAYSWYYPSPRGDTIYQENSISGDTIRFLTLEEKLSEVQVVGGAIGKYLSGPISAREFGGSGKIDTVDYKGRYVEYNMEDSLITLFNSADVKSGTVSLSAFQILFDTHDRTIEAFSAQAATDSGLSHESPYVVQPNAVPVVLVDNEDEIFGDYMVYSIDTKKGRIYQSKTSYEEGLYYGEKLYREQPHIFYIDDGRYTTCNAEEPHFHFYSNNLKLLENDKLIARPVVFYLGRLPLFALPYYVFPLKRGRHSGLLPFKFGNFQQGDRFVRNVGYFLAASDYWDWQGSFDYIERQRTLTFNSRVNFGNRYVFDGFVSGSYARVTNYNASEASEHRSTRWIFNSAYRHTFSPSLSARGFADFRSDATYFDDYSINREERLNREAKSQLSFTKKFGNGTSVSGSVSHTENLDLGTRSNDLPRVSFSLPTIWPFGSGGKDENGRPVQKWYNNFTFRYAPAFQNFSNRTTLDSTFITGIDTTVVSFRSRREYAKVTHNPALGLPSLRLFKYLLLTPRFSYSETWFKIFRTDQSEAADIEPITYRTYSYSGSITARTDFYGTFYPNLLSVTGLRHTITPQVRYRFSPEINLHPDVRAFAGGGAGSVKRSVLNVSVNQVFQAKYRRGETEKNVDLISITSGFSYNYEADERPYSDLRTTFQSSAIPRINVNGSMVHSLYESGTNNSDVWSPTLQSFSIDARFSFSGKNFIFDDPIDKSTTKLSSSPDRFSPVAPTQSYTSGSRRWLFSAAYGYRESGIGAAFNKFSFFRFNLGFNLTPTTYVNYSHDYDIDDNKTIFNSVRIVRQIHCWTGSIYWVPKGSNKGFGFQLHVTAIPDIKIDNNHDSYLQSFQR